jgi:hypothetical protein
MWGVKQTIIMNCQIKMQIFITVAQQNAMPTNDTKLMPQTRK